MRATRELIPIFLESHGSQDFVNKSFNYLKQNTRTMTYEAFAQRAGFSGKSSAHHIVCGRRKVTLSNIEQVGRGLRLSGTLLQALRKLVEIEQFGHSPEREAQLGKLRKRLKATAAKKADRPKDMLCPDWPLVYAALGEPDCGATLEEVTTRLGGSGERYHKALHQMVAVGLVSFDDFSRRYRANDSHVVFDQLGRSGAFQSFFHRVSLKARNSACSNFDDPRTLHFAAAVSIRKSQINHLAVELQKLLNHYVSDIEDPQGDEVVLINASLLPHR